MDFGTLLGLAQSAAELGLICSLTALSLYLSYSMLNVCDLSTDGCFTLGAVVGANVSLNGHPFLALPAAMLAGMLSGFVTGFLQTKMGVNSLLAGIIVNTALYSVNVAAMDGASLIPLNKADTVFTKAKGLLEGSFIEEQYKLLAVLVIVAAAVAVLVAFLKTKLGMSIRCAGDNPDMVRSSSINIVHMTIIGLCASNALTGLSGCLMVQAQKSVDINLGNGMLTIALASLLIGRTLMGRGGLALGGVGVVVGAVIFRLVYAAALRLDMPAFMLKAVSSVIVVAAISLPYLKASWEVLLRKIRHKRRGPADA